MAGCRLYRDDPETATRQGSRLIKNNGGKPAESLKIVTPLDQNTAPGSNANAGKNPACPLVKMDPVNLW